MDDATRISRATAFDTISARQYAAVRPGYPDEVYAEISRYAGIHGQSQILEIGCGTGEATKPFASIGSKLTCIDSSSTMTEVARERLACFKNVRILTISFEELAADRDASFDLLFAATAFHWIDSQVRLAKSARLLTAGGTLAIFANTHPRPFTGFFAAVQDIYAEIVPEWVNSDTTPTADDAMGRVAEQLRSEPNFHDAVFRSYEWSVTYDSADFIRLLGTYSDHVRLGSARLGALSERIRQLIDQRFEGKVTRPYTTTLCMARRV